ncbi:predicted protein [Neisseria gonorrhoeae PID1]|nr:predicted protein [Neisseria gonorrhoeae PID1]
MVQVSVRMDSSFPRRRESGPWNNGNIQRLSESPGFWIPAFAGMTKSCGNDGSGIP